MIPLVLLATTCSRVFDVTVWNPCNVDAELGDRLFIDAPSTGEAEDAVLGSRDYQTGEPLNLVPAGAEAFEGIDMIGAVPSDDRYAVVKWKSDGYASFLVPPSTAEPVVIRIPERLCP